MEVNLASVILTGRKLFSILQNIKNCGCQWSGVDARQNAGPTMAERRAANGSFAATLVLREVETEREIGPVKRRG